MTPAEPFKLLNRSSVSSFSIALRGSVGSMTQCEGRVVSRKPGLPSLLSTLALPVGGRTLEAATTPAEERERHLWRVFVIGGQLFLVTFCVFVVN